MKYQKFSIKVWYNGASKIEIHSGDDTSGSKPRITLRSSSETRQADIVQFNVFHATVRRENKGV